MSDRVLSIRIVALLSLVATLLSVEPLSAEPQPAGGSSLEEQLNVVLAEYNEKAHFSLPTLNSARLRRLASGKVVRIREQVKSDEGPQRITGLLLCDARRDDLWVALRDPHLTSLPELTEVRISDDGVWPTNWYQFFHMPGPFADRHWVIAVDDNIAMSKSTEGRLWEHYWDLQSGGPELGTRVVAQGRIPGVTPEMAARAVYPPTNEGAWLLISLGEGRTVLGYTVRASVGGRIPDRVVESYSMLTLSRLLRRVQDRATVAAAHYDDAHPRIRGGDGEPLR